MTDDDVRREADGLCAALVAGDVERLINLLSEELRRNAGEVLTLLPLPVADATVTSVEGSGKAFVVTLELVGETDTVELQTRWKDRDGDPTIVEASHTSRAPRTEVASKTEGEAGAEPRRETEPAGDQDSG